MANPLSRRQFLSTATAAGAATLLPASSAASPTPAVAPTPATTPAPAIPSAVALQRDDVRAGRAADAERESESEGGREARDVANP